MDNISALKATMETMKADAESAEMAYHEALYLTATEDEKRKACEALTRMIVTNVRANPRMAEDVQVKMFTPMLYERDRWAGCFGLPCADVKPPVAGEVTEPQADTKGGA